ncbi:MAG: hypothetical protein GWO24_14235, partial [Akkermansiaceae bacterium]|nr:hypothetical protein [Akkermansiaceae bacterium]
MRRARQRAGPWMKPITTRLGGDGLPRIGRIGEAVRYAGVRRWVLPAALLVLGVVIAVTILGKVRREVWAYYTDDQGTRAEVQEGKTRHVLWEDPRPNPFQEKRDPESDPGDPINQPGGRLEAAFSPNGTMMVL